MKVVENNNSSCNEETSGWLICNICNQAFQQLSSLLTHKTKSKESIHVADHKRNQGSFVLVLTKENLQPYIKLQRCESSCQVEDKRMVLRKKESSKESDLVSKIEGFTLNGTEGQEEEVDDNDFGSHDDHDDDWLPDEDVVTPITPNNNEQPPYVNLDIANETNDQLLDIKYEIEDAEPMTPQQQQHELSFLHMMIEDPPEKVPRDIKFPKIKFHKSKTKKKRNKRTIKEKTSTKEKKKYPRPEPKHLPCPSCPEIFTWKRKLKAHVKLYHTAPPEYICTICSKKFLHKYTLNYHMTDIHLAKDPQYAKTYICPESHCAKEFHVKKYLRHHIRAMHSQNLKIFRCTECDKVYSKDSSLRSHFDRTHKPPPPKIHLCCFCGSSYTEANKLKQHMVLHSDERPFKCGECHESFKYALCLKRHAVTHKPPPGEEGKRKSGGGSRRAKCNECEKYFRNQVALTEHMNQVHSASSNDNIVLSDLVM